MGYDAKINSAQMNSDLTGIANAIRAKTGSNSQLLFPSGFVSEIGQINHGAFDWMGDEVEFLQEFHRSKVLLSATSYPSWTASKTATSIKATTSLSTISLDLANYEYMVEWLWQVTVAHASGATLKAIPIKQIGTMYQTIYRRPNSLAKINSDTWDCAYVTTLNSACGYCFYYNTSGTSTFTASNSYGIYCSNTASTVPSSSTGNTVNLTPKTPAIYARCNDSYFATGRYSDIDQSNTNIIMVGNLYRQRVGSSAARNMFKKALEIYKTPLEVT